MDIWLAVRQGCHLKSQSTHGQKCSRQFKAFPAIHADQMASQCLAGVSAQQPAVGNKLEYNDDFQ